MKSSMCRCSSRQKSSSSVAFGWSSPDRVEDAAGQGVGIVRHRLVANPGRPQLARQARHLGADLVVRGCGPPLELVGRDRRLQRVVELALVQLATETEVPVRAGQEVVAQPIDELLDLAGRLCRRRLDTGPQHGVVELGRHRGRSSAQVRDAGHRGDRLLDVERGDLAATAGAQVRPRRVEDVADPLHPAGRARESSLQRGELAAEEAEEAAAEDVGVADRRPRQLVELLLLEAQLVDDAEQDAPIDLLLAAEALLGLEVPRGLRPASPGEPVVPASVRSGQRSSCSWLPASVACTG